MCFIKKISAFFIINSLLFANVFAQPLKVFDSTYIPDFSYAGYEFGEQQPNTKGWRVIDVAKHGLVASDGLDDTQALITLLAQLQSSDEPVVIQFAAGRYQISDIIHINRSNLVIRGAGKSATEFFMPRPLLYATVPEQMAELAEYLQTENKVQKEKKHNIHLPYSLWSWSGGFFWTGVDEQRVKAYSKKYDQNNSVLAIAKKGNKDEFTFEVSSAKQLKVGQVVEINWYNPEGKSGSFLKQLYGNSEVKIGSRHFENPRQALSKQPALITKVSGNLVSIKTPLIHDIEPQWNVALKQWRHLSKVGFEHFSIRFPYHNQVAHHVESGFNGLYLTRTFNSWVKDITVENADSAILTESIANVTIENVTTTGTALAHYTVQLGGVHNVLVKGLTVENPALHPLSFNTFANKNVYLDSVVKQRPILDQHSGANHQNLFDNTKVSVTLANDKKSLKYPLFKSGGASYWKPSHGNYNTFWNTQINFSNGALTEKPILLYGVKDGANARIVGVSANLPITVEYGPNSYIEGVGKYYSTVPSLYFYQLNKRLNRDK